MSASALTRRYAKALVELAAEEQAIDRYGEELAMVNAVLDREALLRLLLDSPTLIMDKKAAMLSDLAAALGLSDGMCKVLGLLLNKDRLRYLPQIEETYRRLADERSGVLRAKITAAVELDAAQQQAIGASLEKQTGKKVALNVKVDPQLLGGVQAEIGGRLFDGSVRTQLKRIEESLTKG